MATDTLTFIHRDDEVDVEDRVARGAALLDERLPDWYLHVDTRRLDVSSTAHCVLGQLGRAGRLGADERHGGGYVGALRELFPLPEHDRVPFWLARDHGFDGSSCLTFTRLTEAWRRVIRARRATGPSPAPTAVLDAIELAHAATCLLSA